MIYQKHPYKAAIHRYSRPFSLQQCNVNLHLKDVEEISLTDVEFKMITSLQGLNGKKAKLAMFKVFIDSGHYTYEGLCEIFPNYSPEK